MIFFPVIFAIKKKEDIFDDCILQRYNNQIIHKMRTLNLMIVFPDNFAIKKKRMRFSMTVFQTYKNIK